MAEHVHTTSAPASAPPTPDSLHRFTPLALNLLSPATHSTARTRPALRQVVITPVVPPSTPQ